jgi:thioesterase domain-containing protein/acyl carrier protein
VVVAIENQPGYHSLVAYVVPPEGQATTGGDLRRFLKAQLPDYMVPSTFVFLEGLPRTPNGKIDRKALPAPDSTKAKTERVFIAPKNTLELNLAKMWGGVLGVSSIGIEDNFFDLGGSSLQAIQLCAQISKQLGKSFLPTALFQAPTIEQQAKQLLQEGNSQPLSSLVVVQAQGSTPPFFCIHGTPSYFYLARYLGKNQPVYGLAQHLSGKQVRYNRVQDIAAHYLEEVRTVQLKGPYFLGGHSIGAMIAFEMAQQLRKQGESAALLALIDPVDPILSSHSAGSSTDFVARLRVHSTILGVRSLRGKLNYILKKGCERIANELIRIICRAYHLVELSLPPDLQSFYVDKIVYGTIYPKARKAYVPQIYPGNVIIFHAKESSYDPELSWKKVITGRLEIQNVSGDHLSILAEPNLPLWAEQLKARLRSEQRGLSID